MAFAGPARLVDALSRSGRSALRHCGHYCRATATAAVTSGKVQKAKATSFWSRAFPSRTPQQGSEVFRRAQMQASETQKRTILAEGH